MEKKVSPITAFLIFAAATAYFYLLLFTLAPYIRRSFDLNPAVYWFITGYFLFVPLFAAATGLARAEGNGTAARILSALNVRPFTRRDWAYALIGLALTFLCTGIIFAAWSVLQNYCDVGPLQTTPWFMEMRPFRGGERLLLLAWLPMFFFNIVGEELLWRGYIQKRLPGRFSWLLCSLLWLMFHLPFGIDLLLLLVPVIIIIPCAFHKTRNTSVGIFIHAIYNGPVFIAIALGAF